VPAALYLDVRQSPARAYGKRAYALLLVLYTCCPRIDSLLNVRVEHLGYDKVHQVLNLEPDVTGALDAQE
jgi:hypothetical protein